MCRLVLLLLLATVHSSPNPENANSRFRRNPPPPLDRGHDYPVDPQVQQSKYGNDKKTWYGAKEEEDDGSKDESDEKESSQWQKASHPPEPWYHKEPPKKPPPPPSTLALSIGLGVGIPLALFLLVAAFFVWRWWKKHYKSLRAVYDFAQHTNPLSSSSGPNSYSSPAFLSPAELDSSKEANPLQRDGDQWAMHIKDVIIDYDRKLGAGAFCNVFHGRIVGDAAVRNVYENSLALSHFRDCEVAVKMLPSFADDIARSDFNQEINFMKSLHYHPHLVSMLGYVPDQRSPLLLVEFCGQGDLLHFIRERKTEIMNGYANMNGIKLRDLVAFGWQISNGLEYLNSAGCIHRDVAARNVLVDQANVCKIGDFGLCRLTDSLLYTARGGRLPLRWMAPESLRSYEYSFKSDVWSFGVVLYELFSFGAVPYGSVDNSELLGYLDSGDRLDRPEYCPPEIYQLMLSCWRHNSTQRPSFTELCATFVGILERAMDYYGYVMPVPHEPSPDYGYTRSRPR